MSILVTGGTGYIGSHTTVELLEQGYDVVVIDNLSNSSADVIPKIEEITGKKVTAYFIDLLDEQELMRVFEKHAIEAVLHFAGCKIVSESIRRPLHYYVHNVSGTLSLCRVMEMFQVYKLIFSSSAAVYGVPEILPITEDAPTALLHPYGRSKLMAEDILKDLSETNANWSIVSLRYFNPVGAHASGKIGEKPNGVPTNLMPYISQVAAGKLESVNVYGNDYPTKDGTGIRDYIHVSDLAKGHIVALKHLERQQKGFDVFNLGTGQGYSVLDVIKTFEKVSGVPIPYVIKDRRQGDPAASYAEPGKAYTVLGWKAEKDLYAMCYDAWKWEKAILGNPNS